MVPEEEVARATLAVQGEHCLLMLAKIGANVGIS